jgi:hypothetical protein
MYAVLWDCLNGAGAWLANPWVWAVQFRVNQATSILSSRRARLRHEQSIGYDDFFAGFGFGSATGSFATLDENLPSCGGFGLPRILILLFAIGYFLSCSHHTPEISSEFDMKIAGSMTPALRRALKKYRAKPEVREKRKAWQRAWYARNKHRLKMKRCLEGRAS